MNTGYRVVTLVLFAIVIAIALAGCDTPEEAAAKRETLRKENERLLPAGCRIVDLNYGDLKAAVICNGRRTTSTVRVWDTKSGKTTTTNRRIDVVIEPAEAEGDTLPGPAPRSREGQRRARI